MKKVIGLCLVMLFSTATLFAQGKKGRGEKPNHDPAKRMEQMITDLKLDDTQTAEFRKIYEEQADKMKQERETAREAAKENREKQREKMEAMRSEQNEKVKKILTEDQYKQYLEKQQKMGKERRKDFNRK